MHACMHVCMYVRMYVCMHACMYACIETCIYIYTHAQLHTTLDPPKKGAEPFFGPGEVGSPQPLGRTPPGPSTCGRRWRASSLRASALCFCFVCPLWEVGETARGFVCGYVDVDVDVDLDVDLDVDVVSHVDVFVHVCKRCVMYVSMYARL